MASALTVARKEEEKCAFCMGIIVVKSVKKIKDPGACKKTVVKYTGYFSCFKRGHRYCKCRSKVKCAQCNGDHYEICVSTAANAEEEHPNSTATAALDPTAASWVGNMSSRGRVAWQMALAVVNGNREKRVWVLFDTASHRTFITAAAVGRLGMEPVRKERL